MENMIYQPEPFVAAWEKAAEIVGVDLRTCEKKEFEEVVWTLFMCLGDAWVNHI